MKRTLVVMAAVAATFALLSLSAQQPPEAGKGGKGRVKAPRTKKAILAWADTRNGIGQHDSVTHAVSVIERMGYESGLYDTYFRTDSHIISKHPLKTNGEPASGGPSLDSVDAIFFLGHREIDMSASQKAELLAFVHDEGKGFVGVPNATTAFESWPEFGEMLGARYDDHPWNVVKAGVIIEDSAFPAMKHFPATFTLTDEMYQHKEFSRDKLRVLMRLDPTTLDMSNKNMRRKDGDFPQAWAKMYGKGRVFYSALGHATEYWDNPALQKMYFEAIKWSLGLSDADVTPRPLPTK